MIDDFVHVVTPRTGGTASGTTRFIGGIQISVVAAGTARRLSHGAERRGSCAVIALQHHRLRGFPAGIVTKKAPGGRCAVYFDRVVFSHV
jgi:hypothetical protein